MGGANYGGWGFSGAAYPAGAEAAAPTWGDGGNGTEAIDSGLAADDLIRIEVPAHCHIESVEAHVITIAGGAGSLTMVVYRDAGGDDLFISDRPVGATQNLRVGLTTATEGGCTWLVGKDHHPLTVAGTSISALTANRSMPGNQTAALWFGFYTDAGTAVVDRVVVNWRA